MELDWVQLISWLSALVTVFWAVCEFTVERQAKQKEERKQLSALYINPFLLACEELQSRIYNILDDGAGSVGSGFRNSLLRRRDALPDRPVLWLGASHLPLWSLRAGYRGLSADRGDPGNLCYQPCQDLRRHP